MSDTPDGRDGAAGQGDAGTDATDESSSPTIRELDDRTIRQIAAGEVVERPASVVKELVENSLDADAGRISVAVEAGGTEGIRVRDDGVGMDRAAVERAVEEHTTSKIDTIDDLEAGVGTLGFRGEALHTIGAVSRVTIRTKPRGGGAGTELRVEGGEVTAVGTAGCPEGTVVAIEDLFYNTPARRKFLKTVATEFAHVNTVVTHYAVANPEVAISLEHDDREVFATEGRGDLRSAVLSVYGREVAEAMIDVAYESGGRSSSDPADDESASTPVESVTGLISHPETTRSSREYLSTFVNGRYVTSGVLREAVLDAYGGQLATDRYPFTTLFVDLPADAVDVNVHPRKMEVRYDKPDAVKRAVRTAIENALREEGIIRSSAPRGRSAPDQTPINPETPDTEIELTPEETGSAAGDNASSPAPDGPDAAKSDNSPDRSTDESTGETVDGPEAWSVGSSGSSQSSPSRPASMDEPSESVPSDTAPEPGTRPTPDSSSSDSDRSDSGSDTSDPDDAKGPSDRHPSRSSVVDAVHTQTTLTGDDATPQTRYTNFPDLRVLGQLHDTYIVAETDDGMILVDQHAADERVNYERLQERFEDDITTQELAEPVDIELTAREAAAFDDLEDQVARIGFRADRVSDRTVEVSTVPALLAEAAGPELIRDVITDLVDEDADAAHSVASITDELLSDMACYPSITGNTSLTEGSVVELLEALDACENPYACPHGRPVVVSIDGAEIESRFERDYPGHDGRRAE